MRDTKHFLKDHLDSIEATLDANGTLIERLAYELCRGCNLRKSNNL